MSTVTAEDFARLRAALPELTAGTELVLREDDGRPVALLRPSGAPPRIFALVDDGAEELRPGDDRKLVAHELLGDQAMMLATMRDHLGEVTAAELVAWRPGKRAVVRVTDAAGGVRFVKFLDKKTWRRAIAAFDGLGTAPAPLEFARPSLLLGDLHGYVATAARGRSLHDHLAGGGSPDWQLVDAAVRALAAAPIDGDVPRHDFASARGAASKMLRKAAVVDPACASLADAIEQVAEPTHEVPGFVHGDFHDKQLFLADGRAFLIDLEGVGRGDTNFDLANLAEQLRLRALQQGHEDESQGSALLDRFALSGDSRLRWRAVIRARLCGVYAMRPRWAAMTARLQDETRNLLTRLA